MSFDSFSEPLKRSIDGLGAINQFVRIAKTFNDDVSPIIRVQRFLAVAIVFI